MWCIVLVMTLLDKVKQAQARAGGPFEHWFALGGRDMSNPLLFWVGGAIFAAGYRRRTLKTNRFPASLLLASNKIHHRRIHQINGSLP